MTGLDNVFTMVSWRYESDQKRWANVKQRTEMNGDCASMDGVHAGMGILVGIYTIIFDANISNSQSE